MQKQGRPTSAWVREQNSTRPHVGIKTKPNVESYLAEPDNTDKYELFNEWCKKEGILMPKLQYPAIFEGGLIGTKVTQEITHREAYLAIPFKMMITITKATDDPVIGPIVKENLDLLDTDQIVLALFMLYEVTKGKSSYWYPYLRTMPEI